MPIYIYECPSCGVFEVTQGINDAPLEHCPTEGFDAFDTCGQPIKKLIAPVAICIPKEHRAATYAGRDGDKVVARQYRENKRVAEGLASGTMMPPEGRDTTGDLQPREFRAQFNEMYQAAKKR